MAENKGKGTKGRNYDELSGVGTSSAGITGTTGNLNNGMHDGGIGRPSAGDAGNRAGNRQSADEDDGDTTPALGTGTRSRSSGSRQGGNEAGRQGASQQSGGQQGASQQGGGQQSGSGQSGSGQGGSLGKSLDQDVMGKEN